MGGSGCRRRGRWLCSGSGGTNRSSELKKGRIFALRRTKRCGPFASAVLLPSPQSSRIDNVTRLLYHSYSDE